MGFDNAYEAINADNDPRWAFGTGFADPLAGVDPAVPAGVDGGDLAAYCLMLGDDALVMSHRLQQWCTNAPTLEDEVALANIALDLLGQARLLLTRAGQVDGSDRDEDAFAYFRDAGEFRNVRLVELDNGDFAECVVRLLRLRHVATGAARPPGELARPGRRGDCREGSEGGDLPPRLRRAVGRAPRRRHRALAGADGGRRRRAVAVHRRAVRRPARSSVASSRSAPPSTPRVCATSSPTFSPPCCGRRHCRRPRRQGRATSPDATAATPPRSARCSPSCNASPAPTRRRCGSCAIRRGRSPPPSPIRSCRC